MSTASYLPAARRAKHRASIRRLAAWLAARATDRKTGLWLVISFALVHAVLWTLILVKLKAAQDVHMDVAEAYAWGQRFLLGYGKHPPLSGWIAGVWFRLFPITNWSTYALAMATLSFALVVCWLIALRVVDRRRAFFMVVMLALYPIFNFKGFKFNADLAQLVPLPLLVLAYLNAFEKRSVKSGLWLGFAAALALMAKYWVLTVIGAIGLAALIHPQRMQFLRSPAPWVAIGTMAVAMIPHLVWLEEVDFLPLTYAGDVYSLSNRALNVELVIGYVGHNLALLAVPVLLGLLALSLSSLRWRPARIWLHEPDPGVNPPQALNIWLIQSIVAIGPPLGALAFTVYIKTDWGIPLFFLLPLALVAIPWLRISRTALLAITVIWFVVTVGMLFAAPAIARREMTSSHAGASTYAARSELARELTETWQTKFHSRWAVVAARSDVGEPMTFYSPDHPAAIVPDEAWSSGLTSLDEAKRLGFIGICDTAEPEYRTPCETWMAEHAKGAEQLVMTTQRFFGGHPGPSTVWKVYLVPPAK
ncbi:glycosyltransferase family 39 protein [Bradyrhizobium jicamae]|uniref:Glycosyltransferase family 39 protein n=1 Tax=Bradyrhizobium jicamae TaxID=280332 RepID=A0ABS5FCC6_9BRAD|nr:glycosyltransferase family 39 protein [Bradyrhizobium jicamae]MBR0794440.1 glycosyltransferase family 39 protein [Bradyrhizobium jicamae]MBR0933590.1 glycosyltransferase family 39 protein [Bradyrhizobium jicamae]